MTAGHPYFTANIPHQQLTTMMSSVDDNHCPLAADGPNVTLTMRLLMQGKVSKATPSPRLWYLIPHNFRLYCSTMPHVLTFHREQSRRLPYFTSHNHCKRPVCAFAVHFTVYYFSDILSHKLTPSDLWFH